MIHIFWRYFKDKKNSVVIYTLAAIGFIWMYIALFPSIKEQSAKLEEVFKAYPEGLMAAFGIESLSFDTLEKFLQLELYSFIIPIMIILLVLSTAGTAIAGEIEKGTIENILAKPISRLSLYFGRYLTGVVTLLVFTMFSTLSIILLAALYDIDVHSKAFFMGGILTLLFGLSIFSLGMLMSAIFSEKGRVYLVSGALVLVMYVLFIVAQLKEGVEWLRNFSFFYYFDHKAALLDSEISWRSLLVFVLFSAITAGVGAFWFKRRDIAV